MSDTITKEEQDALLKLWAEVPGTMPPCVRVTASGYIDMLFGDTWHEVSERMFFPGLARDAIVEYITAMDAPHDGHGGRTIVIQRVQTIGEKWSVLCGGWAPAYGPTRLLALISAARAVAGKGGPQ